MNNIISIETEKNMVVMTSPLYADPESRLASGLTVNHPNPLTFKEIASDRQKMIEVGQQFEAYFISYLLKVMRDTVPEGAIANKQGAYFYSFYDEEIGRRAAESGGIGIAQMVQDHAEKSFSALPPAERSSFPVRSR